MYPWFTTGREQDSVILYEGQGDTFKTHRFPQDRDKIVESYDPNKFRFVTVSLHDAINCTQLLSNPLIRKLSLWFHNNSTKELYDTKSRLDKII